MSAEQVPLGTTTNGHASTTAGRVEEIIRDRLNVQVPAPDTDLVESGLLDSLALVLLITALEDTFACELPLDDFDLDRFRTVAGIAGFVDECHTA